jgi:RHS repeat-associated protein
VQQEDFYPFGLSFNSYQRENSVPQNYLYNGKEQINDLGLDWADYGARMYMPEIGRWGACDPLADKYFQIAPYTYVANDPIKLFDLDGKRIYFVNESGELKRATRTMLKTYSGVQIYSKYMRSKTDDVYIGSGNFGSHAEAAGITATVGKTAGFSMNKSKLSLSVKSQQEKNAFGIFGSTDFSKSKGKNVHLVSISNEALKANDQYTAAEIMYHELKAHVEIGTGDEAEDHERYGNFRAGLGIEQPVYDLNQNPLMDADGNQLRLPKRDSPAGQMVQQLLILKHIEQTLNRQLRKEKEMRDKR